MVAPSLATAQQAATTPRPAPATGALTAPERVAAEAEARLSLAVSSAEYPVTPGDVYRLTYYQTADNHVSTDVLVPGDWKVNLGVFGNISARDLTFTELKQRVEKLIADSYSRSLPSLRIVAPGVFRVAVTGEVDQLQYITAWGLTKLSGMVDRAKDQYSSLRKVEVHSAAGDVKRYDLLKAMRLGDKSEDPYVRPGDTIVLVPRGRTVTLTGEVRHPGTCELLDGEGLRELILQFGGGTTPDADQNRVRIERKLADQPQADYVALPAAYRSGVSLFDGDTVVVTSRTDWRSVVWFEGAVSSPPGVGGVPAAQQPRQENTAGTGPAGAQRPSLDRFPLTISKGEMLSDALQEVRDSILPTANLSAATIQRVGQATTIPVDLARVMAGPGSSADIPLRPNDTIFVPSLPSTVSVFGAVSAPGFFRWEPGQPATYYISRAGGVDPERNAHGEYSVTDTNGKTRGSSDAVRPGDRVYVPLNSFGYRVERSAPTVVAIVAAILNAATFVFLITSR